MSRRGRSPLEEAGPSRRDFWGVHEELDPHRKRPGLGAGGFGVSRKRPGPAGREICGVQEAAGAWPGMIEPWRAQFSTEPGPGNPGREGLRGGVFVSPQNGSHGCFFGQRAPPPRSAPQQLRIALLVPLPQPFPPASCGAAFNLTSAPGTTGHTQSCWGPSPPATPGTLRHHPTAPPITSARRFGWKIPHD